MIRVQKEKRCKNGLITYAAKFNEVTSLKNKSFRLKIWNKDTPLEEIDEYINRCNSDRQFFFQEIHKRYGSFDRGDSYTMLVDSCDEEKTNLNLATLPLRKLWETLELDKFFQKLKFKHNKICEQLNKLWKGNGELSTLKAHKGEKIEYSDFHNYIPFFKICSVLGLKNLPLRFSRIELLETINIRCKHLLGVTH